MKKILLIAAVAGLAMASCKKDYTCECTQTTVPASTTTTSKKQILDASKRQAKANCVSWSSDMTFGSTVFTTNMDCELK